MKYITILTRLIFLGSFSLLLFLAGCGGEEKTAQELNTEKLINGNLGWEAEGGSVLINGLDYSSDWSDFTLNFSNLTYTSSGGPDGVFKSSGAWEYLDETTTTEIVLDGETSVFLQLTEETLDLSFSLPYQVSNGRTSVLGGTYKVTLSRVTN